MNYTRPFFALSVLLLQVPLSAQVSWATPYSRYQSFHATNDGKLVISSTYVNTGLSSQMDTVRYCDQSGNVIWQHTLPGQLRVTALTPAWDAGFLIGGFYTGNFQFNGHQFSQGTFRYNLWVAKWSPDGTFAWLSGASSNSQIYVTDIACRAGSVALCGLASDSVDFMGDLTALSQKKQGFVATLDQDGALQNLFYSQSTTTVVNSGSFGSQVLDQECGIDAQGCVYVLSRNFGRTDFGGFMVGHWNDHNEYGPYTTAILKFSPSLTPQRATTLDSCVYHCRVYNKLEVNSQGDCYLTRNWYLGQSGNDELTTSILKLKADGSRGPVYDVSGTNNNNVGDLKLDQCEKVVFTGFKRGGLNSPLYWCKWFAGQLDVNLGLNWLYEDSLSHNGVWPTSIAVLANKDLLISGAFLDTVQLSTGPAMIGDNGGFFASVNVPSNFKCSSVGIGEMETTSRTVSLFPNPAHSVVYIQSSSPVLRVAVHNIYGQLSFASAESSIAISALPPGAYLVKVETERGSQTLRLIVQR